MKGCSQSPRLGSQHRNDLVLALQAARAQPALAHFAGDFGREGKRAVSSWPHERKSSLHLVRLGENIKSEVLTRIQKEQLLGGAVVLVVSCISLLQLGPLFLCVLSRSEAFGAPEGYVDGPVWWLPETLKYKHKAAQEMVKQLCLVSFEAHGRPHAHVQTRLHTQHEAVLEAFLDRHVDYADISNSQECHLAAKGFEIKNSFRRLGQAAPGAHGASRAHLTAQAPIP